MDRILKSVNIKSIGLFSVPAPPLRFAAIGGVFYWLLTIPHHQPVCDVHHREFSSAK
jgi:hypothetical protein